MVLVKVVGGIRGLLKRHDKPFGGRTWSCAKSEKVWGDIRAFVIQYVLGVVILPENDDPNAP